MRSMRSAMDPEKRTTRAVSVRVLQYVTQWTTAQLWMNVRMKKFPWPDLMLRGGFGGGPLWSFELLARESVDPELIAALNKHGRLFHRAKLSRVDNNPISFVELDRVA